MSIMEFLKEFLPGFAATILGIPIGLWANSYLVAQAKTAKKKEEQTRLYNSLSAINAAITSNISQYKIAQQKHEKGEALLDFSLDSSTWDVVKNDVIQYLNDPNLRRQISFHFFRIEELRKIESIYLNKVVITTSALEPSRLSTEIVNHIEKIIQELSRESLNLQQTITSVQAQIANNYRLLPKNSGRN